MCNGPHRFGGDGRQIGEMGTRLVTVDFLERQNVSIQETDSIGQPTKIDHPVLERAAVQDVECRQPHGKKVPTIAEQSPPLSATTDEPLLRTALKRSTSALKADGVAFALGGGYALWVAGGPEPSHNVDLVVAETDVEMAANTLAAAGLRVERPPEDWLFKAYCDPNGSEPAEEPALVDVLHRLGGAPVAHSLLDTADRKSTRLNSSHANISYAVFCLKKKKPKTNFTFDSLHTLNISCPSPAFSAIGFSLIACLPARATRITFFFFNDTATTEIYTLSLHDALPI